ncbi:hypothetical protein GCM10008956_11320 [Deinococcus arenae]|uniref:Uncharacterized protein n=1 Tax=Deinococcus arenae TaxID=1452751 RepID=A0A8H9GKU3_9DEIO|nr:MULTISPECIES: hypothetical protein [Deinococcus]GGM36529.1 hypothetical protein GCM10008956_11320 [Deinococcus arenae]
MSDPHEQANVQQIEWLLGALAEPPAQGQPTPPARTSDLPTVLPDVQADSDELH